MQSGALWLLRAGVTDTIGRPTGREVPPRVTPLNPPTGR